MQDNHLQNSTINWCRGCIRVCICTRRCVCGDTELQVRQYKLHDGYILYDKRIGTQKFAYAYNGWYGINITRTEYWGTASCRQEWIVVDAILLLSPSLPHTPTPSLILLGVTSTYLCPTSKSCLSHHELCVGESLPLISAEQVLANISNVPRITGSSLGTRRE